MFSHIEPISKTLVNPYRVSISRELAIQLVSRDRSNLRPLSLEEVHVAVPQVGRNSQARAVQRRRTARDGNEPARSNGGNLSRSINTTPSWTASCVGLA